MAWLIYKDVDGEIYPSCDECGNVAFDGYVSNGDFHCSLECAGATLEEVEAFFEEDEDQDVIYWTEFYQYIDVQDVTNNPEDYQIKNMEEGI